MRLSCYERHVGDEADFWARTWQERSDEIEARLGAALDQVVSFSWKPRSRVPGACALTLPPCDGEGRPRRSEWLFLTLGMSQPSGSDEVRERRTSGAFHSGHGYELGVLTQDAATWPAKLLYELVTYITEPESVPVGWGHRFAFGFYEVSEVEQVFVGTVDLVPRGELRGLLVWPYLPTPFFLTSTGRADVLIATGITQPEWDLAKATSSPHLLLWFTLMGIGQKTDPKRSCLTRDPSAQATWSRVERMSVEEVLKQLESARQL